MNVIHTDLKAAYIQMGSEVLFLTCHIKILEITISGTYLLNSYLPLSSDRLLKQNSAQNGRSDSHTMHFILAEPGYVVCSGRWVSCFSCSRTVLWKGFAEFVIVPTNAPTLPTIW